jgi:hypothetical protein
VDDALLLRDQITVRPTPSDVKNDVVIMAERRAAAAAITPVAKPKAAPKGEGRIGGRDTGAGMKGSSNGVCVCKGIAETHDEMLSCHDKSDDHDKSSSPDYIPTSPEEGLPMAVPVADLEVLGAEAPIDHGIEDGIDNGSS